MRERMGETMPGEADLFELECREETLIITPTCDLSEFQFREMTEQAKRGFDQLEASQKVQNVVVDFQRTGYFGSTALGLFVQLWLRVCRRGGRMALCNLSEQEREILEITHLADMWPVCDSLEQALKIVKGSP